MFSLILLNGGVGKRADVGQPKQLLRVKGTPVLVYSLLVADAVDEVTEIVMNYPPGHREEVEKIVDDYALATSVIYVAPGSSRHDSVRRMLPYCRNDDVIVHESARPLATADDFRRLAKAEHDNVSYMAQIPFTVAPVEPVSRRVTGYLDRDTLRNVQLPQKFKRAQLAEAHEMAQRAGIDYTEDATLCAQAGFDVWFIDGADTNFKMTTPLDVKLANYLLGTADEYE